MVLLLLLVMNLYLNYVTGVGFVIWADELLFGMLSSWDLNQRNLVGGRLFVRPSGMRSFVPWCVGSIWLDW